MTKTELKTLKAGDVVYDKKTGRRYEFLEVCRYNTAFSGIVYDLLLKSLDECKEVYINSKKVRK